MKKNIHYLMLFLVLSFTAALFAGDAAQEIGQAGEKKWAELISAHKSQNLFQEKISASVIAGNFEKYKGKYMLFPKVDFNKTMTDRDMKKYFYCSDRYYDGFVIEFNNDLTDKLRKYSYVLGKLEGEWEILGRIEEVYGWWNNVVFMKIAAFRIPGKVAAIVEDDNVTFIGEEIIERELAQKAKDSNKDIPKNLTEIPRGLAPVIVAKLFFHLCVEEDNYDLWLKLLARENFWAKKPQTRVGSWWNLMKKGRKYYFVRVDVDGADEKRFYFQRTIDGKDVGSPGPVVVVKEDGQWKVSSANP